MILSRDPPKPKSRPLQPIEIPKESPKRMTQIPPESSSGENHEERAEDISGKPNKDFHVFTWLTTDGSGLSGSASTSGTGFHSVLDHLDTYITENFDDLVRDAYFECDPSINEHVEDSDEPQRDIKQSINEYLQMLLEMDKTKTKANRDTGLQERINLYNAAEDIVCFFMPPGVDINTPTVGKFWKSLENLIRPYSPSPVRLHSCSITLSSRLF